MTQILNHGNREDRSNTNSSIGPVVYGWVGGHYDLSVADCLCRPMSYSVAAPMWSVAQRGEPQHLTYPKPSSSLTKLVTWLTKSRDPSRNCWPGVHHLLKRFGLLDDVHFLHSGCPKVAIVATITVTTTVTTNVVIIVLLVLVLFRKLNLKTEGCEQRLECFCVHVQRTDFGTSCVEWLLEAQCTLNSIGEGFYSTKPCVT